MTAESIEGRMKRGDKMLKLFESGMSAAQIGERFGLRQATVFDALKYARERREKEKAE